MTAAKPMGSWNETSSTSGCATATTKQNLLDQLMGRIREAMKEAQNASNVALEESREYRGRNIGSPSASKKLQTQTLAESLQNNAWTHGVNLNKLVQLRSELSLRKERATQCNVGSLVKLQNQCDGLESWYFLVTDGGAVHRLETEDGRKITAISIQAPLAKTLLTKRSGAKIVRVVNGVKKTYKIVSIE